MYIPTINFKSVQIIKAAKLVALLSKAFKGREADAKLVEKLSIRSYGKGFEYENWLSRDNDVWFRYLADPLCGKVFPVAFYESMFKNLTQNYKRLNINKNTAPVFLIAGDNDPVGANGKGVKKLFDVYKKAGIDVKMKLYDGARHEILNEINKDEVIGDVINFILD